MPLAAWRENSSRHVASLRRIRLVFFIAPVSSTITGRDYPQWTDLRKYVAELPVTHLRLYLSAQSTCRQCDVAHPTNTQYQTCPRCSDTCYQAQSQFVLPSHLH